MQDNQSVIEQAAAIRSGGVTLELVLRAANFSLLVPLKRTGNIIGIEEKTLRNQLTNNEFPIKPVRQGGRVFFDAREIASYIDRLLNERDAPPAKRPGRPRKAAT